MPNTTCPACGHPKEQGRPSHAEGLCSHCGYASGESNRCVHCSAIARLEGTGPSAVCAVCGGPRIPSRLGGETAAAALKQQNKLLQGARVASIATVTQALVAALVTAVGLAVSPSSPGSRVLLFVVACIPLALALRSRSRARRARDEAKIASEQAWRAAAEDVTAQATDGMTAAELAKTLGLEASHADRLLTSLAVHDRTRIEVGDDAEIRYSLAPEALGSRSSQEAPLRSRVSSTNSDALSEETEPLDEGASRGTASKDARR